ncbi:MAG: PAS domain-containing protein, partial [Kiloniellaceae bacterium]
MRRSARPGPFALAAARAFGAGLVALAALAPSAVAAAALGSSSLALWPHGIAMLILAGLLVTGLAIVAALIAMRRLRNALALQRDIFGAIPQPRQVVDSDGHTLLANKAFYAFFGNAARPTPVLLLEEASNDDYACDQLQRLNANARNGTAGHLELRVRPRALGAAAGAAGAEWRYVVAYPISGRPGTVLWMVDDITLRRQMEQVIQEDHERFMDLLEFAPVGFYSVDAEGYFLFANRTLCDWLGLSYEELDGGMIRLHDVLAAPPAGAVAPYEST